MQLNDSDVRAALRCVSELLDRRQLQGMAIPPWMIQHRDRMRLLSASGQESETTAAQFDHKPMTVKEVAQMLHISERDVRRKGAVLGGVKTGRDWHFDRAAVTEHIEGKQAS